MRSRSFQISDTKVLTGLTLGFLLVLVLMSAAGWVELRQSALIGRGVATMEREQILIARLIHEGQIAENAMTSVLHRVAKLDKKATDHSELLRSLGESERQLAQIAAEARGIVGDAEWRELEAQAGRFATAVKSVLELPARAAPEQLELIFELHDRLVELLNGLIQKSASQLAEVEAEIERETRRLRVESAWLLGASVVLAGGCALVTILFVRGSIQRIQWQSGELDRVSWHMLKSQEEAARRFSHELHDELGQSLAAVRSNLTKRGVTNIEELRADCMHLVDESIANVRELSQLLRPVILDDFGLEAGLQWLAEKFAERTRLNVTFQAANIVRYADETETHLFRIAQEALTNIARHAKAGNVKILLSADNRNITLVIEDDGRGLPPADEGVPVHPTLGMVGMRARARQCGGTLVTAPVDPHGLRIEVTVPVRLSEGTST